MPSPSRKRQAGGSRLARTLNDSFHRTPMTAPGRVETAAVGLPRSRAGVNWKSQSGQKRPLVLTFEFTTIVRR